MLDRKWVGCSVVYLSIGGSTSSYFSSYKIHQVEVLSHYITFLITLDKRYTFNRCLRCLKHECLS